MPVVRFPARSVVAALGLLLAGATAASADQHATSPLAPAATAAAVSPELDRGKLFDAVVETIARNFADEDKLKSTDWAGRAAKLRPSVLAAAAPAEAIRLIKDLVAGLHTSHTALYTPDEVEFYILLDIVPPRSDPDKLIERRFWSTRPHYPGIGAFTREVDGSHFVEGIMEGSPADHAGLRYGDEILAVDGEPYSPVAAFRDKAGHTVELRIRRARDASPLLLRVDILNINPGEAFSAATRASARTIERNGKRIGYVHLWAIRDPDPVRSALAALRSPSMPPPRHGHGEPDKARDSGPLVPPLDFLIVDARGKVGGNGMAAQGILGAIVEPAANLLGAVTFSGRDRRHGGEHQQRQREQRPAYYQPGFAGRAVLLTDHHTRSAGDILAAGFRNSKLGQIIGTPTAGALMGGATFVMPGGLLLYVAVDKVEVDGVSLEGRGVAPDIRVERPLPYADGADPVLDAAIRGWPARLPGSTRATGRASIGHLGHVPGDGKVR